MKDDGGPAFPRPMVASDQTGTADFGAEGMSLRDWFAGMALQGMLTRIDLYQDYRPHDMAINAYCFADAMIAEGKKE